MNDKVDLAAALATFDEPWSPPRSEEGASVLVIEPEGTPNTGHPATAAPEIEL